MNPPILSSYVSAQQDPRRVVIELTELQAAAIVRVLFDRGFGPSRKETVCASLADEEVVRGLFTALRHYRAGHATD